MKYKRILFKTAYDKNKIKIGKITRVYSTYDEQLREEYTHMDITPSKRKYSNISFPIELDKILHENDNEVVIDILEKEFHEKLIGIKIERDRMKKEAEQQAKLDRKRKELEEMRKRALYRRRF